MTETAPRPPEALAIAYNGPYTATDRIPTTVKAGTRSGLSILASDPFSVIGAAEDGVRLAVDVPRYPKQDLYINYGFIDRRAERTGW